MHASIQKMFKTCKNRKKRPSREFLQRSADESQSIEDSEFFWNGSDAIVEEIASSNFNNKFSFI